MFRTVFCISVLNLTLLTLGFGHRISDNTTLPDWFLGPENFINETKEFVILPATLKKHPYFASVLVESDTTVGSVFRAECTGTFINSWRHVLTAAHCVVNGRRVVEPGDISIRFYTSRFHMGKGKDVRIDSVAVHPKFFKNPNGVTTVNDLAVLTVSVDNDDTQRDLETIRPVVVSYKNLTSEIQRLGRKQVICTVHFYGLTRGGYREMMKKSVVLITQEVCKTWAKPLKMKIFPEHVCVAAMGSRPCPDGGALLLCPTMPGPIGVFGFQRECQEWNRSVSFSRVDSSRDFMQSALSGTVTRLSDPGIAPWDETYSSTGLGRPVFDSPVGSGDSSGASGDPSGASGDPSGNGTDMYPNSGSSVASHIYIFLFLVEIVTKNCTPNLLTFIVEKIS